MDQKTFSLVAGLIFAVVALFHLMRIFEEWTIIIGDWSVPKSVSWVALVVRDHHALASLEKGAGVYVNTPELIYVSILAAIVIFGFAWWLCSRYLKGHISMLKEQLRFGKEKQEGFEKQLETLKREVSQQGMIINDLRSAGGVPRTQVELLPFEIGKLGRKQSAIPFNVLPMAPHLGFFEVNHPPFTSLDVPQSS